jgi:hypothetical protein
MEVTDAIDAVWEYGVLQGRLVRHFLAKCSPRDLDRFRDVPNGSFVLGGRVLEAYSTWGWGVV